MPDSPQLLSLVSAMFTAIATILIQRGLERSNFYAGFWINVMVGVIGLWSAVLLTISPAAYDWRALPYFIFSGVAGTAAGRFFRVASIEKVGGPVASAIGNLAPLVATGLAVVLLHERVTFAILAGTFVIVVGTVLLSLSGKHVGFQPRHLIYPLVAAWCFGMVQVVRKMGLSDTGPLFDAAINISAALVAATAFVAASGKLGMLRCDRRSLFYFSVGGACENFGVFLVIVALGFGDVSVVSPLSATAPLFVLALAFLFPSGTKRLGWRVAIGTALIVLGVVLLTALKSP